MTNATSVGGLITLQEDKVVLDDGLFEMLLIPYPKSAAELQALIRSLLLQDYEGAGLIFRHAARVHIRTPESFPWSLDGEYAPGMEEVEIVNQMRRLTFLL